MEKATFWVKYEEVKGNFAIIERDQNKQRKTNRLLFSVWRGLWLRLPEWRVTSSPYRAVSDIKASNIRGESGWLSV